MKILEVSDVGGYIKELFELDDTLADLWIQGELTNLSRSAKGHYYFSLKDEVSQLRSVMFRGAALRCGAAPRAGDAVIAHGRVEFYEPSGSCQLCVDLLYPAGTGTARLRFEALHLKLEQEGLFAPERKRPLPEYPRRIGLVTSETGAVLHDVLTVLTRRYPIAEVVLAHSSVQGERAPLEIVAALGRLGAWRGADGLGVEVVVVARGGGSPEELAPFNDERVARAIFASPWPVVSAVGHETDVTICDYVADRRAPTPSAAAEMIAPDLRLLAEEVRELAARAREVAEQALAEARGRLGRARDALLLQAPTARIARERQATLDELRRGRTSLAHHLGASREQLAGRRLQLAALSPLATLSRGYSIVSVDTAGERGRPGGERVVRSARDVAANTRLQIRVADGIVEAQASTVTIDELRAPGSELRVNGALETEL